MKKGELTRQHIIATAAPVFNQRGFAACSMQNLMEATGLEKGGLYRHFTSKEELAAEAFKYSMQRAISARMDAGERAVGALPRLRQIVQAFVQVPSPVPGGCPLMNAAADADTGSRTIRTLARKGLGAWKSEISRVLEEGIRKGEIRRGTDSRRTANTVISLLEGALMICRLEGKRDALADAESVLETVFETIAL